MTLNYLSSIWMALFMMGGALLLGGTRVDARLVVTVLIGFAGVAAILQPTIERDQLWSGFIGLISGVFSAMAYLQVSSLGRAGEPEARVVFYFSAGGFLVGLVATLATTGLHAHSLLGLLWLGVVGVSATLAQVLMTSAYSTGRPLVNASLQYLGIAYSFIYGVLVFDDPVTWPAVLGMGLVVAAGVAAARLRQTSTPARPSTRAPDLES